MFLFRDGDTNVGLLLFVYNTKKEILPYMHNNSPTAILLLKRLTSPNMDCSLIAKEIFVWFRDHQNYNIPICPISRCPHAQFYCLELHPSKLGKEHSLVSRDFGIGSGGEKAKWV